MTAVVRTGNSGLSVERASLMIHLPIIVSVNLVSREVTNPAFGAIISPADPLFSDNTRRCKVTTNE